MEVEDEDQRCILISVLLYGDSYDEVSINPQASRKMVERFRSSLREEFKNELIWEEK